MSLPGQNGDGCFRYPSKRTSENPIKAKFAEFTYHEDKPCMLAFLKLAADFSRGCACPAPRDSISMTHPHPSIPEPTLVHIPPRGQSPVLAMVSLNSCSESAGLLRWIILWQSAHSTVTPPILVRSCSDHSNSGRSERGSRWCTSM